MLLRQLPSNASTKRYPATAEGWTLTEHLLASIVDLLSVANWQRGAKPNTPQPEPIPRPGMEAKSTDEPGVIRLGRGGGMTVEELERRRRGG